MQPEGRCKCPPGLTWPWARHLTHLLLQRQLSCRLLCSDPFGIMSTWMLGRKYISPLSLCMTEIYVQHISLKKKKKKVLSKSLKWLPTENTLHALRFNCGLPTFTVLLALCCCMFHKHDIFHFALVSTGLH